MTDVLSERLLHDGTCSSRNKHTLGVPLRSFFSSKEQFLTRLVLKFPPCKRTDAYFSLFRAHTLVRKHLTSQPKMATDPEEPPSVKLHESVIAGLIANTRAIVAGVVSAHAHQLAEPDTNLSLDEIRTTRRSAPVPKGSKKKASSKPITGESLLCRGFDRTMLGDTLLTREPQEISVDVCCMDTLYPSRSWS